MLVTLLLLVVVIAGLWVYERRRIADIVNPQVNTWVEAVREARFSELTAEQFVDKYGGGSEVILLNNLTVELKESISVKSFLCPEYTYKIHYSFDPAGGANLYGVMENGCR